MWHATLAQVGSSGAPLEQQQIAQPQQQHQQQQQHHHRQHQQGACTVAGAVLALTALQAYAPEAASAVAIRMEPGNALSLPTWAIHVSSVTEWVAAMALMWKYAEVSGNPRWKGMTWAMMPCLGSAMAACTWHFFYNSPDLDFLVALQAFLTVVGNCTCWLAAYRIYSAAQAEKSSA
uniref:Ycf49-like protein n=2 Tax=Tetradesmus obliquus TaxID=3088 RepID=A0A383VL26_TETOB|eukprot:jgi/Sobl393_1/20061/SZX65881.1